MLAFNGFSFQLKNQQLSPKPLFAHTAATKINQKTLLAFKSLNERIQTKQPRRY
jgi:hypothetical protein